MEAHSLMASVLLFIQACCLCSDAHRLNTSFSETACFLLSLNYLCLFSNLFQLQHTAEPQNSEKLQTGLQERRRPRLHHVPARYHELPGQPSALPQRTSNTDCMSLWTKAHLSN